MWLRAGTESWRVTVGETRPELVTNAPHEPLANTGEDVGT
jgi:hypothetical protein